MQCSVTIGSNSVSWSLGPLPERCLDTRHGARDEAYRKRKPLLWVVCGILSVAFLNVRPDVARAECMAPRAFVVPVAGTALPPNPVLFLFVPDREGATDAHLLMPAANGSIVMTYLSRTPTFKAYRLTVQQSEGTVELSVGIQAPNRSRTKRRKENKEHGWKLLRSAARRVGHVPRESGLLEHNELHPLERQGCGAGLVGHLEITFESSLQRGFTEGVLYGRPSKSPVSSSVSK